MQTIPTQVKLAILKKNEAQLRFYGAAGERLLAAAGEKLLILEEENMVQDYMEHLNLLTD